MTKRQLLGREAWKSALLIVFGTVLGLCAAEAVLRVRLAVGIVREKRARAPSPDTLVAAQPEQTWIVYDDRIGWRNKPGAVCEGCFDGGGGVHINSSGFRGRREVALTSAPGVRRILVIGDSVGFGHGVNDDEAFAAQLEKLMPGTEVLNLAVTAYGLDQSLLLYEALGARYRPDDVLIVQSSLYSRMNLYEWGFGYARPRFRLRDGRLWLTNVPVPVHVPPDAALMDLHRVSLAEVARLLAAPGLQLSAFVRELRSRPDPEDPLNQRLGEAVLARLASQARAAGARVDWVVCPQRHWLDGRAFNGFLDSIREHAGSLGMGYIDLTPDFARAKDHDGLYVDRVAGRPDPHAGHWSARGHRLAAEGVARWLRRREGARR